MSRKDFLDELRKKLDNSDYISVAISTIASDIVDGRKTLIPLAELQRQEIALRDERVDAMRRAGAKVGDIAENLGITKHQVTSSYVRVKNRRNK